MEFFELAKYGSTGIALALVGLICYLIKIFSELVKNHLNHSTKVQTKLTLAIEKLVMVVSGLDKRLNNKTKK